MPVERFNAPDSSEKTYRTSLHIGATHAVHLGDYKSYERARAVYDRALLAAIQAAELVTHAPEPNRDLLEELQCRWVGFAKDFKGCADNPVNRFEQLRGESKKPNEVAVSKAKSMTGEDFRRILSSVLCVASSELTPETSLVGDLGVDELDLAELSVAIEQAFDIAIEDQDLTEVRTIGDLEKYIAARVAAKNR